MERQFTSVSELRRWLRMRSDECGDPEAYDEWLHSYFDNGNTITIQSEDYDCWSCWELL